MKIPYRDLSVKDNKLKEELMSSVDKVLSHGRVILGPEVAEFEKESAEYCSRKFGVGMNSGTDAIYLALRSLGIGSGDEVITTPLSWIATTNTIVLTGATPVFVDISEDLNINVDLIEAAITPRTKAIMPVHFTGRMCKMDKILKIADMHGLHVVEDAAQAFGAASGGSRAGSFGTLGCFSMNPMKVLCAYGEAGLVVTDDEKIYEKLLSLRYAGTINKEDCFYPSLNGRIDTLQAAMLSVNLRFLDEKISNRQKVAGRYTNALKDVVKCPEDDGTEHVYYSYTIVTDKRDELRDFLATKGIETKVQHPILMPKHTAYKGSFECEIPVAEDLVEKILCLPNEENLTDEQVDYVISMVKEFFGR
ncbi:DegT/DnrJ/EryC1/StrS family aminotransferase [Candidatus Omnitrophota bacterium]